MFNNENAFEHQLTYIHKQYFKHFIFIFFCLLIFNPSSILSLEFKRYYSSTYRITTINLQIDSLEYHLPDKHIMVFSEQVFADTLLLIRHKDYEMDYSSGIIWFTLLPQTSQIVLNYYVIPDFLMRRFMLYEMQTIKDSLKIDSFKKPIFPATDESKLIFSGSKTLSLTFSNQETFDLKQALYIKLQGELGPNLNIIGQLSDSQSPLSPEGDSRELSSMDEIFLKLYGNQYEFALGDLEWENQDTELMNYKTRFEGLNAWYKEKYGIQLAIGANGGKQTSNSFQGVEGKQGPYYLYANTTGQNVRVVPGSEKVSINGEHLERGNDYTIDYSEGSITFKCLITSNSHIIVDFQYTDDYYRQNLYLASTSFDLNPNLILAHHLIRQVDDKNNPLQWTFSDSDKDSLRNAGDHDVWGEGAIEVNPGEGLYRRKIDSNGNIYYEFAADDSTANYLVYFTYVGNGRGDYEPFAPSKYVYKGHGQGSWLPYKKLIAPLDQTNLGMNITYKTDTFSAHAEGLYSYQDLNTFSKFDDGNNNGLIFNTSLSFFPYLDILEPKVRVSWKRIFPHTFSFANLTSSNEAYLFNDLPNSDSLSQHQTELQLEIGKKEFWKQAFVIKYKEVKNFYYQRILNSQTFFHQTNITPETNLYISYSRSDFQNDFRRYILNQYYNMLNKWEYRLLKLTCKSIWKQNNVDLVNPPTNSNLNGDRYLMINPSLKIGNDKTFSTQLAFAKDQNELFQIEKWHLAKNSDTYTLNHLFYSINNTINLNFTHRIVRDSLNIPNLRIKPKTYELIDLKSSHNFFDKSLSVHTFYQLNQLEFFPQIRELQYVGHGLGSYNADSVQVVGGDYDYVTVTSGESKLSADISADINAFFRLSEKYSSLPIWRRLQWETALQFNENTQKKNDFKIYLFFPEAVFNEDATIYGRQMFRHTIWLDIIRQYLSVNLRYEYNRTLDNRYQTINKNDKEIKRAECELKNLIKSNIRFATEYSWEKDTRYASEIGTDLYSFVLLHHLNPTAYTQWNLDFTQEEGKSQAQSDSYKLNTIKINPSLSWFYMSKMRITSAISYQYNKRTGSNYLSFLPDKRQGSILIWSLKSQFKLNSFTSGSLEYTGKQYPQEQILHELKMEFRAEL